MFLSKHRPLIYPQSEHARLAGMIASLWGNDAFARPAFDFHAFVTGVTLHDYGYGLIDTYSIGQMSAKERYDSLNLLLESHLDDRVAEGVMKYHVLRLIHGAGYASLEAACQTQISDLIAQTGISQAAYQWANHITHLCDSIAFDFCFEHPAEGKIPLYPTHHAMEPSHVGYRITHDQIITLSPWPLSVAEYSGFIFAYKAQGYPHRLQPVLIPYTLRPEIAN